MDRRRAPLAAPPATLENSSRSEGRERKKERRKHKLSEVRADFLDRRRTPLPSARSAPGAAPGRRQGGPAPIQENRADLRKSIFMMFSLLRRRRSNIRPSARTRHDEAGSAGQTGTPHADTPRRCRSWSVTRVSNGATLRLAGRAVSSATHAVRHDQRRAQVAAILLCKVRRACFNELPGIDEEKTPA